MLIESFSKVLDDPRIDDIFISDDASELPIFSQVKAIVDVLNQTHGNKIRLQRNLTNVDCYRNKYHSVLGAKNQWCILLDSDNQIDKDYLDRLYEIPEWDNDTIYTPSWAMPNFDFRAYEGLLITKENVSEYIDKPMFETMCNAANFFVNKETYLKAFNPEIDPVTSDSLYISYRVLEGGGKIKVMPNLFYSHRVWEGSHYRQNVSRTPAGFHETILQKIKQLK